MTKSRRKTVLVIDDDTRRRRTLFGVLKITGADVISASTGAEAMRRLPRETADLIVINFFSENVGAVDFLRELRTFGMGKKIPVFALVESEKRSRTHAANLGVNELLDPDPPPYVLVELACRYLGIEKVGDLDALKKTTLSEDSDVAQDRTSVEESVPGSRKAPMYSSLPGLPKSGRLSLTDDAGKRRKGN